MKIQRFNDYYNSEKMLDDFLLSLSSSVNESDESKEERDSIYKRIENKVISDLRLDTRLVLTFGSGIGALYPVVSQILQNMSLSGVEVTKQTVVLLTIAAITIIYLEEKKTNSLQSTNGDLDEETLTKDSKSMLEELRMHGLGDGIVKKIIRSLTAIKNIFSTLAKYLGAAVGGIIDMFSYTAILIPIMNAILYVIGKYDMGADEIISNFFTISVGVASKIAKHGLVEIVSRLKDLIPNRDRKEIIDELETPVIQKFGDFGQGQMKQTSSEDMITEQ
jgi:hypothetical protein